MSYRKMRKRDPWEIYRRWQAGQSLSHIAANERRDRKTVRQYLGGLEQLGLESFGTAVDRQRFYQIVETLLAGLRRASFAGPQATAAVRGGASRTH